MPVHSARRFGSLFVTCQLSLLLLLLTSCNEFERAAYRTLAVTQAEYELVQSHVAEAAAHGLISEEQWNRFAAEGHRFIEAHNAAVDAFELWSRVKNPANAARVEALLEILPRLVAELNRLAGSFEERESGGDSGQGGEPGIAIGGPRKSSDSGSGYQVPDSEWDSGRAQAPHANSGCVVNGVIDSLVTRPATACLRARL